MDAIVNVAAYDEIMIHSVRHRRALRERVSTHLRQSPGWHSRAEIAVACRRQVDPDFRLLDVLLDLVGDGVIEISCRDGRSADGLGVSIYVPIYRYNSERGE